MAVISSTESYMSGKMEQQCPLIDNFGEVIFPQYLTKNTFQFLHIFYRGYAYDLQIAI